jgi:hypothetical protein
LEVKKRQKDIKESLGKEGREESREWRRDNQPNDVKQNDAQYKNTKSRHSA